MLKKVLVAFDVRVVGELKFIRMTLKKRDEYDIVYLHERLCAGDISDPPYSNLDSYLIDFGSIEESAIESIKTREAIIDFEKYFADTEIDIYVNAQDENVNETCCYYYFSHLFERFDRVNLVRYTDEMEENNDIVSFPIKVKERVELTKADLKQNAHKWEELQIQNKGIILKRDGELVSETYDEIEKIILSVLSGRYRKYGGIYGRFLDAQPTNGNYEHEHFKFCLAKLVSAGVVKSSCIHGIYWQERFNSDRGCENCGDYVLARCGKKLIKLSMIYDQRFKLKVRRKPKGKKKKF